MSYADKLKNPLWQKKRLEILQRDEFTCQACFDSETTLHVHHCYYEWDKDPWTYDSNSLVSLCEECHNEETENLKEAKLEFMTVLSHHRLLWRDYKCLSDGFATRFKGCDLSNSPEFMDICHYIKNGGK